MRDKHWKGPPGPVKAWAVLSRSGDIMPVMIYRNVETAQRAIPDCVPVPVIITYDAERDPNNEEKGVDAEGIHDHEAVKTGSY